MSARAPAPAVTLAATPAPSHVRYAAVALVASVLLAFANTLSAPFIFDDQAGIIDNPSIRQLSDVAAILAPPPGAAGAAGRPVVNLTLALNYALGGLDVRGYHTVNIVLHALAALALFGVLRRTFARLPALAAHAFPAAFAGALLWAVHPLLTESVTCVIQRSELLGALFYLLTLYCFIRATESDATRVWPSACVTSCALGMASKEFVASAPLVLLLYDRAFGAGSFRAVWRARRPLYLTLATTWGLLAAVMLQSTQRNGTVGFGLGISAWDYLLTQCRALVLYLRLAGWPHPLVLDYGFGTVTRALAVLPQALLLTAGAAATVWAGVRRPALGFAGVAFFALLAPSSSVVPLVTQTIAEHRMYLPLAAVVALAVATSFRVAPRLALALSLAGAIALAATTVRRNHDYRSAESIWRDTIAKQPDNPRPHTQLGNVLADLGRTDAAIDAYRTALRLQPDFPEANINLGGLLAENDRAAEALPHLEAALRIRPRSADAHLNLGIALDHLGRTAEAIRAYEKAIALNPLLVTAHANLGDALTRLNQFAPALEHLDEALRLDPHSADANYKRAVALAAAGRLTEAREAFAAAFRGDPNDALGIHNWANALASAGAPAEAVDVYRLALALRRDFPSAHYNLANTFAQLGRPAEAIAEYQDALRQKPDYAEAHNNLGNVLTLLGRDAEAALHYRHSLELRPGVASTHNNLGLALARLGRIRDAAEQFATAVRLDPDFRDAGQNLARARAQLATDPLR